MFYVLSFLLSWLCGMLVILITAFFKYDQFSIIDITSFAVFTFAGFLILFLVIYLLLLKTVNKKIINRQLIYFPVIFSLLANLPVYFLIWKNTPEFYGKGEATVFTLGFMTIGLVFGILWAWKRKARGTRHKVQGTRHSRDAQLLFIITFTEDQASYSYHIASFFDGDFIITAHSH
jgi:hypothetical protein